MKVFGEGQYNLNVVKETRVTKDFLSLDQSIKECQDVEDNEIAMQECMFKVL